ncbi:class II glutamine amidotransferase [Thiotrichales bacterium 19S3-7]|nr:class II glutamine amidotransferase [Thiotrichales bacterium 19S3-7]MCF6802120.1 class II glutamine amidotransferase [Thiotrichales bacterium 19S3-11]
MCRFVAYLSNEPICLKSILEDPENSLIMQSIHAQKGSHRVNADGFGIAWYNHEIDNIPGIFKSIRPAWNDMNLRNIAAKIKSDCVLGHVRYSTEGNVSIGNCHPFAYNQYAMVHNGSIHNFKAVKRHIVDELDDDIFTHISGHTDSEFFFAMILQRMIKRGLSMKEAIIDSLNRVTELQKEYNKVDRRIEINIVLTDGKVLYATKYAFETEPCSLFYSQVENNNNKGVIIASEPLSNYNKNSWKDVAENCIVVVNNDKKVTVESL